MAVNKEKWKSQGLQRDVRHALLIVLLALKESAALSVILNITKQALAYVRSALVDA